MSPPCGVWHVEHPCVERRLMVVRLLAQLVNIAVAAQADIHRIRLRQSRLAARMRIVAIRAIAHRSRMRHLCRIDLLAYIVMARQAQRLRSACVSTTLPSFAGWWQVSHPLPWNGACWNFAISFGASDWCGSWHCTQLAVANG